MPKFRKKPVVIEAYKPEAGERNGNDHWPEWLKEAMKKDSSEPSSMRWDPLLKKYVIHTLEGNHEVTEGDWIIQGVSGELYPCKPDIFEATYEPVD